MTLGLLPEFVNTSALRYFYEVAQTGSFRRAADKIRIAPSAISRQIQLLEEELGVELFERGRKGVRLTVAGETLVYRVRRTMNELAAARAEIGALHGRNRGLVTLGVNETIGRQFIIDFLARFHKAYPGITFNVVVGNTVTLVDLLLRGEVEIIVGYGVPERRGLERVASFNLDTCIVVRKEHRLAQKKWVRVSDFLEEELILPDESSFLRQVLNAMFAHVTAKPLSAITINSFELMTDMVAAGLGIGAQIRLTTGADEMRPDIVYVPVKDSEVRAAVLACCIRAGRVPSAAVSTCAQQLANALQIWAHGG
ncbi:MAG TPA: LysR family transcriptional regulator [Alphaproteobacteria bacterium]|nr:LysR family transcriptional regulator [Alphaproteobacteria bacterium]